MSEFTHTPEAIPPLRESRAGLLASGQKFYLTADGKFPDTFREWHGYGRRYEKDPVTGIPMGKAIQTIVYTCELGYREEIPVTLPVYVPA
ncbi:hypothetical protein ABZ470_23760 [Streptosporangium sp. NPDC020072]|uniref:hypothetical protein n=1 Tax=Streptosporangium sp. NPDC020072 TaxID=3154788 RepID=UPI003443553D